jgi:DNA polymerase
MDPSLYKKELLEKLYAPYTHCTQCPLGFLGRTHIVFGEGNTNAKLMFVGEGPGQEEDRQGRPFVGRSGQLLTRTLEAVGISRDEVFITNIVKCRPPNNRKPYPAESKTCKNLLLLSQIKIIRPQVICTLGAAALEGLLEKEIKISHMRGKPIIFEFAKIIPTYHPAYILRNPNELKTLTKDLELAISMLQ